jgi:hypothetical protein
MRPDELADFFRQLGDRVVETQSCFWYSPQPFIFKSLSFHKHIKPSRAELSKVLLMGPAIALRYPSAAKEGEPVGATYICDDRNYDFASLSQNVRSHTRRGLARCRVEQIGFDYLARTGHALTEQTTMRQMGIKPSTDEDHWQRFCRLAGGTPGIEAWGAFVGDKLATFLVGMQIEDCYYIHLQKSASSLLKFYPNNALLFSVIKAKLVDPDVRFISHGAKAIAARKSLELFKTGMGFRLQPYAEQVVFNPVLKPILMWKGDALASRLARRYPKNLFWLRASRALKLVKGDLHSTLDDEDLSREDHEHHDHPGHEQEGHRREDELLRHANFANPRL